MNIFRLSRADFHEFSGMLIPIMIEQLFLASIGLLITFFVRKSGMEAVASVSLINSVNMLINQVFMSIGVGVSVVVAQYRGRNDVHATGKVAQQGVMLALLIALVVGTLVFFLREPVLKLLLADSVPLVYEYSRTYLTYFLMSMPFLAIFSVSSAALRGSGHPRSSLIAVLTYNGFCALLSFLATTVADMGLLGVSRAQLISSVLAAAAGFMLLLRGNEHLRINRFVFKIDKEVIKPILKVGIPVLCENVLFALGRLVTQTFAVPYGTNHMAANGIVNNINMIMCVPVTAAVNAAPPIIGRYCGRGDKEGAMLKGKQLIFLVVIIQSAVSLVAYILMNPLSTMMTDIVEVQELIRQVLSVKVWVMPLGFTLAFIIPSVMRSSGDMNFVMYINVLTMFTMRIGVAYLLTHVIPTGIIGIWIGQYADWAMRICFFIPRFLSGKWLTYSLFDEKKEESVHI